MNKMKAAKGECTGEQYKNIEKRMTKGNSKETYNTLKALSQNPTAYVSSHRRQPFKHPDRKHSCSKPMD